MEVSTINTVRWWLFDLNHKGETIRHGYRPKPIGASFVCICSWNERRKKRKEKSEIKNTPRLGDLLRFTLHHTEPSEWKQIDIVIFRGKNMEKFAVSILVGPKISELIFFYQYESIFLLFFVGRHISIIFFYPHRFIFDRFYFTQQSSPSKQSDGNRRNHCESSGSGGGGG